MDGWVGHARRYGTHKKDILRHAPNWTYTFFTPGLVYATTQLTVSTGELEEYDRNKRMTMPCSLLRLISLHGLPGNFNLSLSSEILVAALGFLWFRCVTKRKGFQFFQAFNATALITLGRSSQCTSQTEHCHVMMWILIPKLVHYIKLAETVLER